MRALGREFKGLCEQRQMSQEVLGVEAGYQKGAGVSISRIESGTTRPSMPRLCGIACALGLTTEELEGLAGSHLDEIMGVGPESGLSAPESRRSVENRQREIEERTKLRTECVDDLASLLERVHTRARDN